MFASRAVSGDKLITGPFSHILGYGDRPRWPDLPVVPHDRMRSSTPQYRSTPTPGPQDWISGRQSQLQISNDCGAVMARPSSGMSVASSNPAPSQELLASIVVKTIADQEAKIQRIRVQVMKALDKLAERAHKEAEIRGFLEQCQAKSQSLWAENAKLQEHNNMLKQQVTELKNRYELINYEAHGRDVPSPDSGPKK